VTAALKTVSKVSRIFCDTIHLPSFTSSMLRAYCYSLVKVLLNACACEITHKRPFSRTPA
jgi:hypothetical protein